MWSLKQSPSAKTNKQAPSSDFNVGGQNIYRRSRQSRSNENSGLNSAACTKGGKVTTGVISPSELENRAMPF